MPDFDPTELISLAEELLSNLSGASVARSGPDQAKVRTAIGRSYYAAFLVAREKLVGLGYMTARGGSQDHLAVVDALGGKESDLGGKMYGLRLKRNQADYNLNPSGFTLQAGLYWLGTASEIIVEVNSLV
jgi:hypothetical protein